MQYFDNISLLFCLILLPPFLPNPLHSNSILDDTLLKKSYFRCQKCKCYDGLWRERGVCRERSWKHCFFPENFSLNSSDSHRFSWRGSGNMQMMAQMKPVAQGLGIATALLLLALCTISNFGAQETVGSLPDRTLQDIRNEPY
jgi:hypothetical protein